MSKKLSCVVFDRTSRNFILKSINKISSSDGFLVEKNNTNQKVLTREGEEIRARDVGVIRPGSQIFIKKDIVSLIKFASDLI